MDRRQEVLLRARAETEPEFGAFAPTQGEARARALAKRLPATWLGLKLSSLLLGPAGGRSGRAFDVDVFESQKARLHPGDNICEKRVFLTPQLWDARERAILAAAIAQHSHAAFYFCDVGANAGLYTLFVRSITAQHAKKMRAICIEPDPVMISRLIFNLKSSGAFGEVALFSAAAAAEEAPARFAANAASRGLGRLEETGELVVAGRPLLAMIVEAGAPRLDALKIDIEGREGEVLGAFFAAAPAALWPRLVILETSHEAGPDGASALLLGLGYQAIARSKRNVVLKSAPHEQSA